MLAHELIYDASSVHPNLRRPSRPGVKRVDQADPRGAGLDSARGGMEESEDGCQTREGSHKFPSKYVRM